MIELSSLWHDPRAYFLEYRRQEAAALEAAVVDEPNELIQPWTPTLLTSMPRGPKSLATRLRDAGWEVFTESAINRIGKTYYKGTDRAGEPKSDAHELVTWQVRGRRRQGGKMVAAVLASWEQKKSCGFDYARTWDVVTKERDFHTQLKEISGWLDILAPLPVKKTKEKAA